MTVDQIQLFEGGESTPPSPTSGRSKLRPDLLKAAQGLVSPPLDPPKGTVSGPVADDAVRSNFDHLDNYYRRRVLKVFRSRGFQQADAEELVQEVFFEAFQNRSKLRCAEDFEGWLYLIVRRVGRKARYHLARQGSRREKLDTDLRANPSSTNAWLRGTNPARADARIDEIEHRCSTLHDLHALWASVVRLPPKHLYCFIYRLQGADFGWIAKNLGIKPGTARAHLSLTTRRLQKELEEARSKRRS